MSILKTELKAGNNALSSYFPARTALANEGEFDWSIASSSIVQALYRKKANKTVLLKNAPRNENECQEALALKSFEKLCKEHVENKLDEPELWQVIKEMYFSKDDFYQLSPETHLFKLLPLSKSASQHRLSDLFSSLLNGFKLEQISSKPNNFLEGQIIECLGEYQAFKSIDSTDTMSKGVIEKPYLPFMSKTFVADLAYLAKHPNYLIAQLNNLLRIYGFLYTTQLALNIRGLTSEPSAKPMYFILENERASRERSDLTLNGYQNAQTNFRYIFPYLSLSEMLQDPENESFKRRVPLWDLYQNIQDDDKDKLQEFVYAFEKDRFKIESPSSPQNSSQACLDELLRLAEKQFDKGNSRHAAREKFIKTTENELCASFAKPRSILGKIACLNQDYISLLTNVVIADNEKMRLHDVLEGFNQRGIYFDKQSQKALIKFYERVGNVERMSDSGDAVYVRKTI